MSNISNSWIEYTQEILAWDMGDAAQIHNFAKSPSPESKNIAARLVQNGQRRNAKWYILLGCDHESLCLALASELANSDAQILIIEDNTNAARNFINTHEQLPKNIHIITDSSPWALYFLTLLNKEIKPENSIIHWAHPPQARSKTLNTWRKLFLGAKYHELPTNPLTDFKLSIGAILHPDEAQLGDFFEHIPSWVHEVIVVWDTDSTKDLEQKFSCKAVVKHFARCLNNDFSAQRNAMLSHCTGNWLLYLDADERLSSDGFLQLAHMANLNNNLELGGIYFPRLTFEGDINHIRMAHGLWPDIQLRFFPLKKCVHFVGSIHEKPVGLNGNFFLAPHLPIVHYSHIYKNAEELHQRLAVFNAAGSVEHKLSKAYPRLNTDFFEPWNKQKPCLVQIPN